MKLSYRGVDYNFDPSSLQARGAKLRLNNVAKARSLSAMLTYRGVAYAIDPSTQAAPLSPSVASGAVLTYRGISYTVQSTLPVMSAQAESARSKTPTRSIQDQVRSLAINHHRAMTNRQQVMLARSAAEVGMTAMA